jgi:hypothetical protein
MERLPIKFEEVLANYDIKWSDTTGYCHVQKLYGVRAGGPGIYTPQTKHAIAGIAIEAMKDKVKHQECVQMGYYNYDKPIWEIYSESYDGENFLVEDTDFCECVYRAIMEIYGTKEEKDAFNKGGMKEFIL